MVVSYNNIVDELDRRFRRRHDAWTRFAAIAALVVSTASILLTLLRQ